MIQRLITVSVLSVIAALVAESKAEAQIVRGFGGSSVFVGPGGPVNLTPGYDSGSGYGYAAPSYAPANVLPYSYYGVPSWQPARIYQGPDIFPFYGRPYGHPYDRWTWPYMSGAGDYLARYYYPPLG